MAHRYYYPVLRPFSRSALPFCRYAADTHYPTKSPLEDVLRLVPPGSDEFVTEKYALEIRADSQAMEPGTKGPARDLASLAEFIDPSIQASRWCR